MVGPEIANETEPTVFCSYDLPFYINHRELVIFKKQLVGLIFVKTNQQRLNNWIYFNIYEPSSNWSVPISYPKPNRTEPTTPER